MLVGKFISSLKAKKLVSNGYLECLLMGDIKVDSPISSLYQLLRSFQKSSHMIFQGYHQIWILSLL